MRFGGRWARVALLAMAQLAGAGLDAAAQAPDRNNALRVASVFTPPSGLAGSYHVALASRWDRPGVLSACGIDGGETVEGTLAWTGAHYEGMLRRASRWRECAAHGPECTVTVEGGAEVQAAGDLEQEDGKWMLALRWTPARDVRVAVGGDCPKGYRAAVERMYRFATHRVAFELPPANAFVQGELDPYPWAVRVE